MSWLNAAASTGISCERTDSGHAKGVAQLYVVVEHGRAKVVGRADGVGVIGYA
ncbi:MAG: hypothetical protein LKI67_09585 [Olsenella sp.]|nr:hypothetical protein [Olsenella sp.]MCI1646540.1 hypothetical protein [Olsenella sp.]MCI1812087.1 hypothetical protein [Olsenella sp.]MCI1880051.1 hypothetical protein [Olsenella sp.]